MASRTHGLRRRAVLLALLLGAAALGVYVVVADDRSEAASVVGTLLGLVAAVGGLAPRLWRDPEAGRPSPEDVARALDGLADVLLTQWTAEAEARGLLLPSPVPVSYSWTDRPVADDPEEVVAPLARGAGPRPVPGVPTPPDLPALLSGSTDSLHELYAGVPSGRLVLLGEAGSGKTGAAVLLLLAALAHRRDRPPEDRRRVPVPVLLSLGEWHPREQGLVAWAASRLLRDHAFLRTVVGGDRAVARLVQDGDVALVLDGFDELSATDRVTAADEVARAGATRVVLTTRPDEYEQATRDGHVHGAAVLELRRVRCEDAARYLLGGRTSAERARWERFAARLATSTGVVPRALSTPFVLSLVRSSYGRADDPEELFDTRRFSHVDDVEAHLMGRLVRTAYADGGAEGSASSEPSQRWLEHLARRMSLAGTRDLAWWHVPLWVSTWVRFGVLLVAVHTGAVMVVVLSAAAEGLSPGDDVNALADGLLSLLVPSWVLAAAVVFGAPVRRFRAVAGGRVRLQVCPDAVASWLLLGNVAVLLAAVLGLLLDGQGGDVLLLEAGVLALVGLLPALVLSGSGLTGVEPTALRLGLPSAGRVVAGIRIGICVGLVVWLLDSRLWDVDSGQQGTGAARLAFWVGLGAFSGCLIGAAFSTLRQGQARAEGASPTRLWSNDLRAGLALGVAAGLVCGVAGTLTLVGEPLRDGAWRSDDVGASVREGLGLLPLWVLGWVVLAVVCTGAVRLTLVCLVLRCRGQGPVRLLRFLEDARRRQLLRRVGGVYQFRHARLQDHLAGQPSGSGSPPARRPAAAPSGAPRS